MRINDEGEESNNTDLDKVRTRGMWDNTSDARENPAEHGQVTMEHERILWGREEYLVVSTVEVVEK